MSFLCELVLYSVENYGFYFNGLKKVRRASVTFLTQSQSLCSGLKKKKLLQVWSKGVCVLKDSPSFFVCFSFCPNGKLKSVLIAQTHGQKVILYLPSVVPSFVYLLLNCLRRTDTILQSC